MVHLRCTVPRRCPRDAINQGEGGGGDVEGEGGLPPARSVFNISGDERNRMVEAKGFPQEWWTAAGNRCIVCLLVWPPNLCSSTSVKPTPTPLSSFFLSSLLIFSPPVLFSHQSHSNKLVHNNIQGPLKVSDKWMTIYFLTCILCN